MANVVFSRHIARGGFLSITRIFVNGLGRSITLVDDDGRPRFLECVSELPIEINVDAKFCLISPLIFFGKLIFSASFFILNMNCKWPCQRNKRAYAKSIPSFYKCLVVANELVVQIYLTH